MKGEKDSLWVVQHNKLAGHAALKKQEGHAAVAEKVLRLGTIERRLMGYLFAVAGKTPQEVMQGKDWTPVIRLSVAEYERVFGDTSGHGYEQLEKAIDVLLRTVIRIESDSGNAPSSVLKFPLLVESVYTRGEGWFEVELSKRLKPYLHDLSRDFSRYKLDTLGRLSSSYAIRLYEWCKANESQRVCRATFGQLCAILGVDEEKARKDLSNFKRVVLDIALEQVNDPKKTDLIVTQSPDRAGRGGKIVGWTFKIETRKQDASGKPIHDAEMIEHPRDVVPRKNHLVPWWDWVRGLNRPGCDKLPDLPNWEAWDAAGIQFSFSRVDQVAKGLARNLYEEWLKTPKQTKFL